MAEQTSTPAPPGWAMMHMLYPALVVLLLLLSGCNSGPSSVNWPIEDFTLPPNSVAVEAGTEPGTRWFTVFTNTDGPNMVYGHIHEFLTSRGYTAEGTPMVIMDVGWEILYWTEASEVKVHFHYYTANFHGVETYYLTMFTGEMQ